MYHVDRCSSAHASTRKPSNHEPRLRTVTHTYRRSTLFAPRSFNRVSWQFEPLLILAPAEPLCLTPCCTTPQDKGDMGRANGRRALSHVGGRAEPRRPPVQVMMVAGQNLENHRIRVSCFPSRGFMFSLIGFVFPF